MLLRIRKLLFRLIEFTRPRADQTALLRIADERIAALSRSEAYQQDAYFENLSELIEARQMAGGGPWRASDAVLAETDRIISRAKDAFATGQPLRLQESLLTQGANGMFQLEFQNIEWRREIQMAWLEFSRWGIQQLILICRLNYVKNPWVKRIINVTAAYVLGQGCEISSPDKAANEALKHWRTINRESLGQNALTETEKRKSYDGNVFWCCYADTQNTGDVLVRIIDATEIQEIAVDPDDPQKAQYYRRTWTKQVFNLQTGQYTTAAGDEWHPALNYEPDDAPEQIGGVPVIWQQPIYHRKVGGVAQWRWGCPRVYAVLDWAREGKRHLTACAATTQAQAQIAMTITTKGGQQAIAGIKNEMGTTFGPNTTSWDMRPPAMSGSTMVTGPGTTAAAFKSRGTGTDPAEVKEYRNMAACAGEIPPTWMGDMETSNLATAQTLDRPTELGFISKQEEWQEDLAVLAQYALRIGMRATNGKLRESRGAKWKEVRIVEAARVWRQTSLGNSRWVHEAKKKPAPDEIEIVVNFPEIRQGDVLQQVQAVVSSMTLENKAGQIIGIDEKIGVTQLYRVLGIPNADEIALTQYPESEYDPDRTTEVLPAPIQRPDPQAGGTTQLAPDQVQDDRGDPPVDQAKVKEALARVERALKVAEYAGK